MTDLINALKHVGQGAAYAPAWKSTCGVWGDGGGADVTPVGPPGDRDRVLAYDTDAANAALVAAVRDSEALDAIREIVRDTEAAMDDETVQPSSYTAAAGFDAIAALLAGRWGDN